jgi:hypothetical protein
MKGLLVGAPCFSRGKLDFSPAGEVDFEMGFSPGYLDPSAKAHDQGRTPLGALKRSYPRMNAGAPTGKCILFFLRCSDFSATGNLCPGTNDSGDRSNP